MSVIGFAADEVKSLEIYARDLCGEHVAGPLWAEMYVSNHNEHAETYGERRSLTDAEKGQYRREYAAAPARDQYTPKTPEELMNRLQSLIYNCGEFAGELETARRMLLDCVAFELMVEGGPAVYLDAFASVQRVDFDTYRMLTTSTRPGGRQEPYRLVSMSGQPHPYEGLTVYDPRDLFRMVWQMHEDCAADYRVQDSRRLAEFMALIESGHTYQSAQVEMLRRKHQQAS